MKPIVSFNDVSLMRQERVVLNRLNFSIDDHCVIMGKNGCGKTSIFNLLYGMFWPTSGNIEVLGHRYGKVEIAKVRRQIGILQPQLQNQLVQKHLNVYEILASGYLSTLGMFQRLDDNGVTVVEHTLDQMQWQDKKDQSYDALSSGEKFKLLFYRAIINKPDLLLLDEPTASLDYHERENFFRLLEQYCVENSNAKIIIISHRLEDIPHFVTQAMLIKNGQLLAYGEKKQTLIIENFNHCFDLSLNTLPQSGE